MFLRWSFLLIVKFAKFRCSGARRKNIGEVKCDVVVYDVTNQIFKCDADKPIDIATSEWLVFTLIWTRNGLMCNCTRPVWPGMSKLFSARASFKIYAGNIW